MSDVHAIIFGFTLGAVTAWLTLYLVGQYLSGAFRNPEEARLIDELAPLDDDWTPARWPIRRNVR